MNSEKVQKASLLASLLALASLAMVPMCGPMIPGSGHGSFTVRADPHDDPQRTGRPSLLYYRHEAAPGSEQVQLWMARLENKYGEHMSFVLHGTRGIRIEAEMAAVGLRFQGLVLRDRNGRVVLRSENVVQAEDEVRTAIAQLLADPSSPPETSNTRLPRDS